MRRAKWQWRKKKFSGKQYYKLSRAKSNVTEKVTSKLTPGKGTITEWKREKESFETKDRGNSDTSV